MLDYLLGTAANLLQVSAGLTGLYVFLTTQNTKERHCQSIVEFAATLSQQSWLVWLRRSSRRAYRILNSFYGIRAKAKPPLLSYLTPKSLTISIRVAAAYLLLGMPLLLGLFMTAGPVAIPGVGPRLIGLGVLIAVTLAIWATWRRAAKQKVDAGTSDKFGSLLRCTLLAVLVPLVLSNGIAPSIPQLSKDAPLLGLVVVLSFFVLWCYLTYSGLRDLTIVFGVAYPVGLVLLLVMSIPVGVLAPRISSLFGFSLVGQLRPSGFFDIVGLLAAVCLFIRAFSPAPTDPTLQRIRGWVAYIGMFIPCAELFMTVAVWGPALFSANRAVSMPLYSGYLFMGSGVATLGSLIYANAIADWLSVGVTRRLLVAISSASRLAVYCKLVLLDFILGGVLVALAYTLFVILSHLFMWVSGLPVDDLLYGIRSYASAIAGLSSAAEAIDGNGLWTSFGQAIGYFVLWFSLTALLPTLLHAAVIALFVLSRLAAPMLAVPSRLFLRHIEEVQQSATAGESSRIRTGMIYAAMTGILVVMFIAGQLLARLGLQ